MAWIVGISWLAIDLQKPPSALAADAPEDVFAAVRAQKHLTEIARAPHPTGSAEAKRVREFLLQKLADLELEAQVQIP